MGFVVLPKTWSVGEILTSGDQNSEFAAIVAVVNGNLDDSNLSAGAAIQGSKLAVAPNGVDTTRINDLAVTTGKLADGSVTAAKVAPLAVGTPNLIVGATASQKVGAVALTGLGITTGEGNVVVLPSITVRGGPVLLMGNVAMMWEGAFGGAATGFVELRVYRDGTVLSGAAFNLAVVAANRIAVPCPSFMDLAPAAGAHVYKFTAQCTVGVLTTDAGSPGSWFAVEMA